MNIETLEKTIRSLTEDPDLDTLIYDLLLAYELPKASITRLRKGTANLAKGECDILWKNRLCYKLDDATDLHALVDQLKSDSRVTAQKPRFLIVTDGRTLLAIDTRTDDTLETPIGELARHFDFFLPWAGMEKSQIRSESVADVRAAEKMGRLYDLILTANPPQTDADRHSLNVFLSRLLFCFFAEDTRIFAQDQFTRALASHTATDGSDLQQYLTRLFKVLAVQDRKGLPDYLKAFPYVNGGLFCDQHPVPTFDALSRKIILECGGLNWKDINPDIFGSMIQAVVHTTERGNLGIHYTSVLNIMKVIEPLFLNDLRAEFEKAGTSKKKLEALLERLYRIRVFDPACGSGNFLIIAYKELSRLEIETFQRLYGDQTSFRFESKIQLTQFYGIEIDGFAAETAKLSLWLAEHQMNLSFEAVFGTARPTLPLHDGGYIAHGNATRLDWEEVCPQQEDEETYVLGNPPYLGQRNQEPSHKSDMQLVFASDQPYKNLDYVCCWFLKASDYLTTQESRAAAFVATSSVCQGRHASLLWPKVYRRNVEIFFAHQKFRWSNNARNSAGVSCVIVGLRTKSNAAKRLYVGGTCKTVLSINSYLTAESRTEVSSRRHPISRLPQMIGGNQPREGGHLFLDNSQRNKLLDESPESERFLARVLGTNELLTGKERWCLWIEDSDVEVALKIPEIARRVGLVKRKRANGNTVERSFAGMPHRFVQINRPREHQIVIPNVSTDRREYLPIDYVDRNFVVTNLAMIILDGSLSSFGIVNSKMHSAWVRAVAGRLGDALRYTVGLCYNTFPIPSIPKSREADISELALQILDAREAYPEWTLEQLYNPDRMPPSLRKAHHQLDWAVERCYRDGPFTSNDERLECLFKLYETMIDEEKGSAIA